MARILIAGLGKGILPSERENEDTVVEYDYKRANYIVKKENSDEYEVYYDEYFVMAAIEKNYNIDKTIYIGTAGSMWDKLYAHYCEKNKIPLEKKEHKNFIEELKNITRNANKNTNILNIDSEKFNKTFENCEKKVEILVTKYGMNREEIFENFNSIINIINKLNENDEIYLDITHSFRSSAMWIFLVMNYITDVIDKNIKIKMITYGMLEEMDDLKDKDGNKVLDEKGNPKKVAPIINLSSFYELMKWIKGANAFKGYGNSYEFLELLENENLKENMKEFSNSMNLNYIGNIKENIKNLKKEKYLTILNGPEKLLLPEILNNFIETFGKEEETHWTMLKLANWHYNQKRYSLAYINIVESIYMFGSKILNLGVDEVNNKEKEKIRNWISAISDENKNYKKLSNEEIENRIELHKIFEKAREIRNTVSHSLEDKTEMKEIISNIKESIERLYNLFEYKYSNETIIGIKDLKDQVIYDYLEKECEKGNYVEISRIITNGIYEFLFEMLNVENKGENKNLVKEWLDNQKIQFSKSKEKEQLSRLMEYFSRIKNCTDTPNSSKEIVQKIRQLKNILINKNFVSGFKNINLSNRSNNLIKKKSEKKIKQY